MVKIFEATMKGKCAICKNEMLGTRILKDSKTGQYCHADCIFPNKAKSFDAHPTRSQETGAGATPAPSFSDLEAQGKLDDMILARVHRSKQIVAKAFNIKPEEVSIDNQLVAVVLSQIGAEVNIRKIQRNKLENMSKIGR